MAAVRLAAGRYPPRSVAGTGAGVLVTAGESLGSKGTLGRRSQGRLRQQTGTAARQGHVFVVWDGG